MSRTPYRAHPYREVPYLLNSQPGPLHHAVLAFAHRGADVHRENTEAAFRHAVNLGFRYIETDVRTTSDGHLVMFHDETLDRVTTGTGRLSDHTWEQLARLRVTDDDGGPGEPLARFDHVLEAFPDTHFNVDLKDDEAVEIFTRIVTEHRAEDRVLAASFHDRRRRAVRRRLGPGLAVSPGWGSTALMVTMGPLGLLRLLKRLTALPGGISCVQVPPSYGRFRVITDRFVRRCHRAGLQVHVWVVDEPEEMERLLDLGVDGLMTDNAQALAEVMARRSAWPQTPDPGSL